MEKMTKYKKWKKLDVIMAIVAFERDLNNIDIVKKRKYLWQCMDDLKNDSFMKKFIVLW